VCGIVFTGAPTPQLVKMADRSPLVQNMRSHPILRFIPKAIGFTYLHILLGYALIDFTLLKWNVYQPVSYFVFRKCGCCTEPDLEFTLIPFRIKLQFFEE